MTAEDYLPTIISKDHKDNQTVEELFVYQKPDSFKSGISHQQIENLIAGGVPINGFKGGIIVDHSVLEDDVPSSFPNSTITDSDGNSYQMKWKEYANYWTNEKIDDSGSITTAADKALLDVENGGHKGTSRRSEILWDEFKLWIDEFCQSDRGGYDFSNLLTLSSYMLERDTTFNPSYVPEEEQSTDINKDGIIKSFVRNLFGV